MSTVTYKEFEWDNSGAGNGESGAGLTRTFINIVAGLENVKHVCDLGSGNGYMAHHFARLGYEVTGVDGSKSGIATAQANGSEATFVHTLIDSTLRERTGLGEFDLVISSDVIEHLYHPSELVEAALSLLKPHGYLLIGTPYHGYLKNLVLSLLGKMDSHFTVLHDGGHIKFFSVKTLSAMVERYGFSDLKFTFYGRAPWLWMNMICLARKSR
jgi:2-polyprenyl-3-methyl-5-hydroxy-6-metoxy-1,4-benzoquinol methylase